jgi:radical SAM protein with 4Fe4S-binding SPASM domain
MNDLPDIDTGITLSSSNNNKDGCSFPFKQIVIDNEGDILPCCKMGGKKLALGNIKNMSLKDAWNSKKMKDLRDIHKTNRWKENSVCKRCILNE